jgi:hypothetical protein
MTKLRSLMIWRNSFLTVPEFTLVKVVKLTCRTVRFRFSCAPLVVLSTRRFDDRRQCAYRFMESIFENVRLNDEDAARQLKPTLDHIANAAGMPSAR